MAKKKRKSQDGTSKKGSRSRSSVSPEQRQSVQGAKRLVFFDKGMSVSEIVKRVREQM